MFTVLEITEAEIDFGWSCIDMLCLHLATGILHMFEFMATFDHFKGSGI